MEPHPNLRGKSEENQKDQPGWCEQLEEARRARPNRGEVKTTGIGCGRTLPKNTGLHSLGGGLAQSLSATLLPPRFCYYIRLRRGPDVCHATNWSTQGGWSFAELSPGHPGCSPYCKEKPPAPPPLACPLQPRARVAACQPDVLTFFKLNPCTLPTLLFLCRRRRCQHSVLTQLKELTNRIGEAVPLPLLPHRPGRRR